MDANWNATLKRNAKFFKMLGITLEIPSISNQRCKIPSISKWLIWNTWHFDQNSRFCTKIQGFIFELLDFSFEIADLCCQNTKKRVQVRTYTYHVISYPLVSFCTHFGWPHVPFSRPCYLDFVKTDKVTSKRERDIPISSMKPTLSMLKVH